MNTNLKHPINELALGQVVLKFKPFELMLFNITSINRHYALCKVKQLENQLGEEIIAFPNIAIVRFYLEKLVALELEVEDKKFYHAKNKQILYGYEHNQALTADDLLTILNVLNIVEIDMNDLGLKIARD